MMESRKFVTFLLIISIQGNSVISSNAPTSSIKDKKPIERIYNESRIGQRRFHEAQKSIKSDAMMLYSIAAKKFLQVKEKKDGVAWDPKYQLALTKKKDSTRNKFFTESEMYHNFRVRSQNNYLYVCGSSKGKIVFKNPKTFHKKAKTVVRRKTQSAFKNKRFRRRCHFTWGFTSQMHIQLSVKTLSLYLAVKNNQVILTTLNESTELERSFIWIPATKLKQDKHVRYVANTNQRSFDADSCDALEHSLIKKNKKIKKLNKTIDNLNNKLKTRTCF